MASKLTTCFVFWNLHLSHPNTVVRFPSSPSHRLLLPASCKMRQRSLSSQHKKQQIKKASHEQPSTEGDSQPDPDEDSERRKAPLDSLPSINNEILGSTDTGNSDSGENLDSPVLIPETTPSVSQSTNYRYNF
ncbi:hypothetical protein PIB30_118012 [Stylosanthes scabra]|uniref:Uncharacterized protein n=1 Tax=Stylosanthes scabra TaxID=79078 RepID=A0ABU6X4U3_9FABA|nr:hypothetical protein [Stylosanthes scabra]